MSDNLALIAIAAVGLGLLAFSVSNKSIISSFTPSEEQRIQDTLRTPGSVPLQGECTRTSECSGGTNVAGIGNTSICSGGKCLPMVRKDDITQARYNPVDLGLKQACGQYVLLGDGMKCDSTAQCGTSYLTTYADDPSNASATVSSKTFCGNGQCKVKGKDWLGVLWDPSDPLVRNAPLSYDPGVTSGDFYRKNIQMAKTSGCQDLLALAPSS